MREVFREDGHIVQYVPDDLLFPRALRGIKLIGLDVVSEANDIDSFAILRYAKVLEVEHLCEDLVSSLLERTADYGEGLASVVTHQTFYVFAEDYSWFMVVADSHYLEKQYTARLPVAVILEAFVMACEGERLAGESYERYVERGMSSASIFPMPPATGGMTPKFRTYVFAAHSSHSDMNAVSMFLLKALSNLSLMPPTPENRSMDEYLAIRHAPNINPSGRAHPHPATVMSTGIAIRLSTEPVLHSALLPMPGRAFALRLNP